MCINCDRESRPLGSLQEKLLVLGCPYYLFMYLLYLDESGDTGNWQDQRNFVIAGIAVHESAIEALGGRLRAIQKNYFPQMSIPLVFHATDIRSGHGLFRTLQPDLREKLLIELYQTIYDNRFPIVAVFGSVMGVESAKNPYQDRSSNFEEVISGFNSFLVMGHRLGHTNKGLIIIDKNREEQYKQLLDNFQDAGTKYGYLGNIVDIPYFARCHDTPMLQFADLCAYAIYRCYEKQDNKYLKIILPRVYRNVDGKMFGLKHITTSKPCACLSCVSQTVLPK
jgi:hypothetical protein